MTGEEPSFDDLIRQAWEHGIQGWDWSYLDGRMETTPTSWDYPALARQLIRQAGDMLEIGTGGGELFSTLGPFPPCTIAAEAYPPSVGLAGRTLHPLGVQVVQTEDNVDVPLPFASECLDLIVNRHAGYNPRQVYRLLRPGGRFLTQQVGGQNNFRLNELFQEKPFFVYHYWTLAYALEGLLQAGFDIITQAEEFPPARFCDIGALVYYLKVISWQVMEFDIVKDYPRLRQVHALIQAGGGLTTREHRFIIEAVKR